MLLSLTHLTLREVLLSHPLISLLILFAIFIFIYFILFILCLILLLLIINSDDVAAICASPQGHKEGSLF